MNTDICIVMLGVGVVAMLAGCHNDNSNTTSTSSTALTALERSANANGCDSFTPSPINGQSFPQDPPGEAAAAINGAPSPLNCTPGM